MIPYCRIAGYDDSSYPDRINNSNTLSTLLTQKQWKDIRHKYIEAAGDDDEDDE